MKKTLIILNLIFLLTMFVYSATDDLSEKAIKMVKKQYSQNLIPALKILQRDNQDELFIKGWKSENAFKRLLMIKKVDYKTDSYVQINRDYDLEVKSKYNKYKNIYIVSYLFALGDSSEYYGFYWWVDPKNHLMLDISENRRLCRKYHLRQYSMVYSSTLRLKKYENEIQKLKTDIDISR